MEFLKDSVVELIIQTSTNLPPDVRGAMGLALRTEESKSESDWLSG